MWWSRCLLAVLFSSTRVMGFLFSSRRPMTRTLGRTTLSMITMPDDSNSMVEELLKQNQLFNAFSLILRDPYLNPDNEQITMLLNNLDVLATSGSATDVSRFYERLQKLKGNAMLPSFGVMAVDGPTYNQNLPDFESLLAEDPAFFHSVTQLSPEIFDSLVIPNECNKPSSAKMTKEKLSNQGQQAIILAMMQFYLNYAFNGQDTSNALSNVAITILFSVGLIISESTAFFNGQLTRAIGWKQASMTHSSDVVRPYRQAAATFIVSYLLGSPVQSVEPSPINEKTQQRFQFSDAPRVQIRDPALLVLETSAMADMTGLKRLSTVHMAGAAIDAIDGQRPPMITGYTKTLLAALAQRATSPYHSTIRHDEFPRRLLPTLARWGFIEAVLLLREVEGSGALDAVMSVFQSGGGVGDAIVALESCISAVPLDAMTARKWERLETEAIVQKQDAFSMFHTLNVIHRGALTATPLPDSLSLGPIEYIKGTDRIIPLEELILPRNPSPGQVKQLTRDVMMYYMNADKAALNGKVSPKTKKHIEALSAQVANALKVYEGTAAAAAGYSKDFVEFPSSTTLSSSSSFSTKNTWEEQREVSLQKMLEDVGLSKDRLDSIPPLLTTDPLILETITDVHMVLKAMMNSIQQSIWHLEEQWIYKWKIIFEHYTGLSTINNIDYFWDSENLSTGICFLPTLQLLVRRITEPVPPKSSNSGIAQFKDTTKELEQMVEQLSYQAPDGTGSTPKIDVTRLLGGLSFSSTGTNPSESNSLTEAVDVKNLLSSLSSLSSSSSAAAASDINIDPPILPSSPTNAMLKDHEGIKYQILQSRQQQLLRNVAAIEERVTALKKSQSSRLQKSPIN